MLFEQVYLLYIYILLFELAMVTVVAIALFVALVVAVRKIDSKKTHLCLVNRDVFHFLIHFSDTPHFVVVCLLYLLYKNFTKKSIILKSFRNKYKF